MPDHDDDDDDLPRYASRRGQYSRTGRNRGTYSATAQASRPVAPATTDHLRARGLPWWISPGVRMSVAGFPVHLSWSILVYAVLPLGAWLFGQTTLLLAAVWVGAVVLSILVHELGHAVVARRYGLGPVAITVHGVGGYCVHQPTPHNPQRLAIALAGPTAGLALAAVAWGLSSVPAVTQWLAVDYGLDALIWVGLLWSGLNLLPILPLDGGNALAAWLRGVAPSLAMPMVWAIGAITSVIAIGVAVVFGEWFVALLAVYFGIENGRKLTRWRRADRPRR